MGKRTRRHDLITSLLVVAGITLGLIGSLLAKPPGTSAISINLADNSPSPSPSCDPNNPDCFEGGGGPN